MDEFDHLFPFYHEKLPYYIVETSFFFNIKYRAPLMEVIVI